MLIGIHAKSLSERQPTGVGEYVWRLLQHMLTLPEAREYRFRLYADKRLAFRAEGLVEDAWIGERILRAPLLWTQGRLAWELARHAPDIFFTPQHVLPRTTPTQSVVTIHGLEFERYPQFYSWHERVYLRWVTKDAVRRAAHIIAVSQATKNDLTELYNVPEKKITVVYHGAPTPLAQFSISKSNFSPEGGSASGGQFPNISGKPYFLYIGRIEMKKNVDGVVRAFEIAKERYRLPHKLVLAGGDGHGAKNIKYQIANSKYGADVKLFGYVTDEQKWELLKNAEALVSPSWYEGFGLPILEAQTVGMPVITSNVSAMPEVAGKGALYVNPADPETIAEAMHRVASDATLRKNLIEKGKENCKRFSWETCARETLNVLCNL